MEIIIDDSEKICEIQEEFTKQFPYLKLEFFEFAMNDKKIFISDNHIRDTEKTIGEKRHLHLAGALSINGHQKISTLEKHLIENFGLYVKVYRRSGKEWILIDDDTEDTLSEHNKKVMKLEQATQSKVINGIRSRFIFLPLIILVICSFNYPAGQNSGPHGGELKPTGGFYIELKASDALTYAYLLNKKSAAMDNKAMKCDIHFVFPDSTQLDVNLQPFDSDGFITDSNVSGFIFCRVNFNLNGKIITAKFENQHVLVDKKKLKNN